MVADWAGGEPGGYGEIASSRGAVRKLCGFVWAIVRQVQWLEEVSTAA